MTVQVHVKADYHIFERGTLLRLSPRTARDRRLMYPFGPVMVRRGWTQTEAAHALGVNQRQITRWLGGGISERLADEIACRVFNVHPSEIWPRWYWENVVRAERSGVDVNEREGGLSR